MPLSLEALLYNSVPMLQKRGQISNLRQQCKIGADIPLPNSITLPSPLSTCDRDFKFEFLDPVKLERLCLDLEVTHGYRCPDCCCRANINPAWLSHVLDREEAPNTLYAAVVFVADCVERCDVTWLVVALDRLPLLAQLGLRCNGLAGEGMQQIAPKLAQLHCLTDLSLVFTFTTLC
eukprot:c15179_g1_i1.p1 GENE.c15179_g1_i1~~c15179_g1_i1.p1  ORF type:complete len:177 (-),score=32.86 c15179_g1_i1:642-1172(-)